MKRVLSALAALALLFACTPENNPPVVESKMKAVDLGLSVKWAACNLGAEKPEEYGDYYAWGETETKANYDWSTYKYANGDYNKLTKYCPSDRTSYWDDTGDPDNKTVLDPEDDVVHVKLGGNWRMPTIEEWTELLEKCTWTWTTQNGVTGRLVTASNGNSIFLPAAGIRERTDFYAFGSYGLYWSSSLNTEDRPDCARYVDFGSGFVVSYGSGRCYGKSVRPVSE